MCGEDRRHGQCHYCKRYHRQERHGHNHPLRYQYSHVILLRSWSGLRCSTTATFLPGHMYRRLLVDTNKMGPATFNGDRADQTLELYTGTLRCFRGSRVVPLCGIWRSAARCQAPESCNPLGSIFSLLAYRLYHVSSITRAVANTESEC